MLLLDGEVLLLQPLAVVERGQGLLRSGNEVLVRGLVLALCDLVQFFIELLELGRLGHEVLEHELRGLVGSVSLVEEELQAVVDKGQVEEQTVSGQAVSSVTDNLDTTLRIISIQTGQNLVVRKAIGPFHDSIGRGPGLDDLVVILLEFHRSVWEKHPHLRRNPDEYIPRCCSRARTRGRSFQ